MFKVDLNADIGESFGAWKKGMDAEVLDFVTSANIACGWHAGDPVTMENTLRIAKNKGVAVGAHPGYPDLLGFGRRNLNASPAEVKSYVTYQIGAFYAFAKAAGLEIQHVKPHGAMYNMAAKDIRLASAIASAVKEFDSSLILMGLSGSRLIEAAEEIGLKTANEVFADRAYEEDGTLVARTKEGAMITDEELAIKRVAGMVKNGTVEAITGKMIALKCDSVCVHGDNPKAVAFVKKIADTFRADGIEVKALR